ncbi:MAG: proline dehydrogenase family protein [Gammaproteobacteria bacterium]
MVTHAAPGKDLETSVLERGRRILSAMQRHAKDARIDHQWVDRFLQKIVEDERFRVQALRFVDVLPALKSDGELARHLEEYFAGHDLPLTGLIRFGVRYTRADWATALLGGAVRKAMKNLARRFLGGADIDEVLATAKRLRERGIDASIDLLGEAIVSEAEADSYRDSYLRLLEEGSLRLADWATAGEPRPQLNVSLKITSLYSQITPVDPDGSVEGVASRLRPILLAACAKGAFVCLDMEHYDIKGATLECFRRLLMEPELRSWPDIGIAIQAYQKDTEADLKELAEWAKTRGTPVTVRLVRGSYWDYETVMAGQNGWPEPVWLTKWQTDACYERCTGLLMDNHPHLRPAIATHNIRSIALAMELAKERGLGAEQFEFQMLHGMAPSLENVIPEQGFRLRIYVPFGELLPGMAYFVRRLLENTSSQSFQRMSHTQHLSPSQLLATPHAPGAAAENITVPLTQEPAENALQLQSFRNQPRHRFTARTERLAFHSAIATVRKLLGQSYGLAIGGESLDSDDHLISLNPARPEEIVGKVAQATPEHVERAVEVAASALEPWSALKMERRARYLLDAAGQLRTRRDEFAAWEIFEAGKTWAEADADVTEAIDFLEYYARQAMCFAAAPGTSAPGEININVFRPRGVGLIVPPWNFPLAILTGMLSGAIVGGNTVILKPSSQTPVIAARFVALLQEVGLPQGVVQFVPGSGDVIGDHLVTHPGVHFIAFTGSQTVGTRIVRLAAKIQAHQRHVKHVVAEMGGKNAVIVDSDADLDDAVIGIAHSAFGYQGQKCSACSRAIVVGGQYERFLKRLIEATRSLKMGLPEEPGTFIGPVIAAAARDRIRKAIEAGQESAKLVLHSERPDLELGYFVPPAIFSDVQPDSPLAQEEIFGPVLAVMRAKDLEQALQIANQSVYALTGGLYSRSPANIAKVRRQFQVGNLYVNRKITGALVGRQPFGGYKLSGLGSKAGGADYLRQFLLPVTLTENTLRRGFAPGDHLADIDLAAW